MVRRSISSKDGKRHAEVDAHSKGLVVVDGVEQLIHDGGYYQYFFRGNVLTAASQFVTIQTGSKKMHLRVSASASLDGGSVSLYEDPTLATAPDEVAINKNRSSASAALARFDFDIVPSPLGTLIAGDNVSAASSGSSKMFGLEDWVLKPNTKYSVQLFNNNAGTNLVVINLEFSEEQP